jgi:hypothetical protein
MARWDTRSASKELMGFVAHRYIAVINSLRNILKYYKKGGALKFGYIPNRLGYTRRLSN